MKPAASHKRPSPSQDDLREMIRAKGLRSTGARVAVLRHFFIIGRTSSHAELFVALHDMGVDRVTIYRVLTDFVQVGILSRTDLGDHVWRFELTESINHAGEHAHFMCIDCGAVQCLPGISVRLEQRARAPRAVVRNEVNVQLKGRCDKCS